MNNASPFATKVLNEIKAERQAFAKAFAATGATAEIGIVAEAGTFTVNVLNGPTKATWNNVQFSNAIEAVKAYAKNHFGTGTLKKGNRGTFLLYTA